MMEAVLLAGLASLPTPVEVGASGGEADADGDILVADVDTLDVGMAALPKAPFWHGGGGRLVKGSEKSPREAGVSERSGRCGGAAVGLFLTAAGAATAQKRRAEAIVDSVGSERDAWNSKVVRVGDTIGDVPELQGAHPNCYLPQGVLTLAFRQVGKNRVMRRGIEGCTKQLPALISVAQAAFSASRMYTGLCHEYSPSEGLPCDYSLVRLHAA